MSVDRRHSLLRVLHRMMRVVVLLVGLLAAEVVVRLLISAPLQRLRWLAACMLSMAVVALIAMMVCVSIVWSSALH